MLVSTSFLQSASFAVPALLQTMSSPPNTSLVLANALTCVVHGQEYEENELYIGATNCIESIIIDALVDHGGGSPVEPWQ